MAKNRKLKTRFCKRPDLIGSPSATTRSGRHFRNVLNSDTASTIMDAFPPLPSVSHVTTNAGKSMSVAVTSCVESKCATSEASKANDNLMNVLDHMCGSMDKSGSISGVQSRIPAFGNSALNMFDVMSEPTAPVRAVSASAPIQLSMQTANANIGLISPVCLTEPVNMSPGILPKDPIFSKNKQESSTDIGKNMSWSSLFANKPKNAGSYVPKKFEINCIDGVMIPPQEVIEAGSLFWKDQLVGFFLGDNPSYSTVRRQLRLRWRLKGNITMRYDNRMFFFDFSCPEDRQRVLESDPIVIDGQPFIVTPWSPSVDSARDQVLSIPVWVRFTMIPTVLQSMIGINWLASLIGDLVCFDLATVKRERLVYATALIEITPDNQLPSVLTVAPVKNCVASVNVAYRWKPPICTSCSSFGHLADVCSRPTVLTGNPDTPKVHLPRPMRRLWVPKAFCPTIGTVSLDSTPAVPANDTASAAPIQPDSLDPILGETLRPSDVTIDDVTTHQSLAASPIVAAVDNDNTMKACTNRVFWCSEDHAWVHSITGIQYSPFLKRYYKYATDEDDETRVMLIHIVNDSIELIKDGDEGLQNFEIMSSVSWDRAAFEKDLSYGSTFVDDMRGYIDVIGSDSEDEDVDCGHDIHQGASFSEDV